ncbi:MAG: Uma2 family endonuclease [Phycisphaerae bacterium]
MVSLPVSARNRKPRRLSVDEYLRLPDDGSRYELIRGQLVLSPSYFHPHGRVSLFVGAQLDGFVRQRKLGVVGIETDVVFAEGEVRRPDIHFVSRRRRSIIRSHVYGAPDLVVEITSPGNWQEDIHTKRDDYERFGVREYWVLDIADGRQRAYAWWRRAGLFHGGEVREPAIRSRVLKGFSLKLAAVWDRAAE